ncbi:MAG: DUF11 domain-containing protein, partial [Actinobacteria bacterium]|nr:DUF11 domain-containing protein [Actinomycetota bacterium]
MLNYPVGIDVDARGNLYIADSANNRIRMINRRGIITTVAGTGDYGYSGDGGPATSAAISQPQSVFVDPVGNLYIADWGNNVIRKVDPSGIITTVAGTGVEGYNGDGIPATTAQLHHPSDMAVDAYGNLYIADTFNNRIRKVDQSGIISTVAGTGEAGYNGDGGPATSAQLNTPVGVEVQGSGNLFISDYWNAAIRRVDASGIIDTVAGMGSPGYSGDGGYGPFALMGHPQGLELDAAGNLYIAEPDNSVVRRLVTSYLWIAADPDPTAVGESFTYDLSVSGLPAAAKGVTLTATLPTAVTVSAVTATQGRCTLRGASLSCRLGTVQPGTTARVLVTATAQQPGIIPINAAVASSTPGAIPGDRTVTAYTRIAAANCGQVITETTQLTADIGPCAGDG